MMSQISSNSQKLKTQVSAKFIYRTHEQNFMVFERQESYQKHLSLDNIRMVENNLLSLKSKINSLTKQSNTKAERIFMALDCATSVLTKKISQTQHARAKVVIDNKEEWISASGKQRKSHSRRVQMFKSRSISSKNKELERRSNSIRQESKINNQIIMRKSRQSFLKNRIRQQKVKQSEKQSRRKIQQFHLLKQETIQQRKFHIRRQRRKQQDLLKARTQQIFEEIAKTQNEKNSVQQKLRTNNDILNSIKSVLKYIKIMKKEEVDEIVNKFQVQSPKTFAQSSIQNVLIYVNKMRKRCQNKENKID